MDDFAQIAVVAAEVLERLVEVGLLAPRREFRAFPVDDGHAACLTGGQRKAVQQVAE